MANKSVSFVPLGKTGLSVCRSGFGALPIQRISRSEAVELLNIAFDNGMNFFDTARMYSDSEEKLGLAFDGKRQQVVIATKSLATTKSELLKDIETSLKNLRTDYLDLLQLHNPSVLPDPSDPDSSFAGLCEAQKKGMIRFKGFTNHSIETAIQAAESGLYDTIQFPLNPLSSDNDIALIDLCKKVSCGIIAMKPLSGGLITKAETSFAFLRQFADVVPIWGIQRVNELREILGFEKNPPLLNADLQKTIDRDKAELSGMFCRGCGYCMPCPQGIQINWAARMFLLLRRAPYRPFLSEDWQNKMRLIKSCTHCNQCGFRCPYGLDTPSLLESNLADYERFYEAHKGE